ncbi:MAG: PKD domain-containing protein [Methanobacteriota archaeon]
MRSTPLLSVLSALSVVLAGCVGSSDTDDLGLTEVDLGSAGTLAVSFTATATPQFPYGSVVATIANASIHRTTPTPAWVPFLVSPVQVDLSQALSLAQTAGSLPVAAGSYDKVSIAIQKVTALHEGRHPVDLAVPQGPVVLDLPIDVAERGVTSVAIDVVLDRTVEDEAFRPYFGRVVVTKDGVVTKQVSDYSAPKTIPPVARMQIFASGGALLLESDFAAEDGSRTSLPATTDDELTFFGQRSEALEKGATVEAFRWTFGDGAQATGPVAKHTFAKGGAYEVKLDVTDSLGAHDSLKAVVEVVFDHFPETILSDDIEGDPANWVVEPVPTGPNVLVQWRQAETPDAHSGGKAWYVGLVGAPAGTSYASNADTTLKTVPIEIPAEYKWAGLSFWTMGDSEACCDGLTVSLLPEGAEESVLVGQFFGKSPWTESRFTYELTPFIGKKVEFVFHFASDLAGGEGQRGYFVDDLLIGGSTEPLVGGAPSDGHGHAH